MEDTQAPRLICLARVIRNPVPATAIVVIGSIIIYTIIHSALDLPIPLSEGIYIATAIAVLIGYPIFSLIGAQNRYIRKQYHQLKELNEQKNVLLSLIAHDMRSPLAQLKQSLDFAAEDSDYAQEALAGIPTINRRVTKTLGLLDNLLTWSRGSFHSETEGADDVVALCGLINDLTEQLQEPLQEKQLVLTNHVHDYCTLSTQTDLLKMVLRNLISNAIKYTPENGHIDIDCRTEGRELCLSVSDTGIGMDDKTLGELLGSERISTYPGTRGETGSGIGLLLCKQLLHSIGGKIRVESRLGEGSRFHVYLPVIA